MSFFGGTGGGNKKKDRYTDLTLSIKQTVLERAHHRCQSCSVKLHGSNGPFFEHVNGSRKDNRPANLRALCEKCFEPVKKKENRKGIFGTLRNNFGMILGK
jgi:5-methylcytosine-specific restriction endonuclease McrA